SEKICHQPLTIGNGRGQLQRFYFDPKQRKCSVFIYSGLKGNENNFLTFDDCEKKCQAADPCSLPLDQGHGDQNLRRFYFDPVQKSCETFLYKGSMGNENNFLTEEDCSAYCLGTSFDLLYLLGAFIIEHI
uniref:BPTI/Kunitz inhibitor domain-containing protein n=1 Tax=Romanomermis culicivorax TaxID=13658 RepID=A0A915K106_ROMCU